MNRSIPATFLLCAMLLPGASVLGDVALSFDGTNDRVTVPYDASFPTAIFTVSAWIKLDVPGHRSAIVARGEDDDSWNLSWQLYVNGNGTFEIMLENANEQNFCYPNTCMGQPQGSCTSGDLFVADDEWHHVAATRDAAGTLRLFVDGVTQAECSDTGLPSANNFQDLTIGCTHGWIGPPPDGEEPPVWFFPGLIDEPAMWSVALSTEDVQLLHTDGVEPDSNGLVGYWTFDEGKGQQVADLSPAGNHGVLGQDASADTTDPEWIVFAGDCDADLDCDGNVGPFDLAQLLAAWGACPDPDDCPADLNADGTVGPADLAQLLGSWGEFP